jgi:hypothetical protein
MILFWHILLYKIYCDQNLMTHCESIGCAYLKGLGHETGCKNLNQERVRFLKILGAPTIL